MQVTAVQIGRGRGTNATRDRTPWPCRRHFLPLVAMLAIIFLMDNNIARSTSKPHQVNRAYAMSALICQGMTGPAGVTSEVHALSFLAHDGNVARTQGHGVYERLDLSALICQRLPKHDMGQQTSAIQGAHHERLDLSALTCKGMPGHDMGQPTCANQGAHRHGRHERLE
jgi:hypothetical protein